MTNTIEKKLNINLRLEDKDKETHYLIKRLVNFQTDTQVVYYMYGQFRKYLGENPDYIIDLKQAREALDTIQNLNDKVNLLRHELEVIKAKQ